MGQNCWRRVHEKVGPDLDLDADDIEHIAINAAWQWPRGLLRNSRKKAGVLAAEQPAQLWPALPSARELRRFTSGERIQTANRIVIAGLPPGFFSLSVRPAAHAAQL